ncbi:MAG TPA: 4-coumarate--CoA ligase family protein [Chloroflexota bacterium]|nr:4-coumarate--CoA ligase family protein [Chloroflexota bacterium]
MADGPIFRSPFPEVQIPETPLTEFILGGAAKWGDKPALIDSASGRSITYGELPGLVRRCAYGLSRKGFGKGDVLALWSPNLPEYAVAFLGVAELGGIVTTANPLYTAGELNKQLLDSKATHLVTVPPLLERAAEAAQGTSVQEIFVFGEAPGATPFASLLAEDGRPPSILIDAKRDVVTLPYSSGTTGLPKGVMLSHYNLVANIKQMEVLFDANGMVGIAVLPFYHIYGMVVLLLNTLYGGGTLVVMSRFDLEQFLEAMQKYKVTHACLVPPIVLALAKHPLVANYDLSALEVIMSGAAPLSAELEQEAGERIHTLVKQGYGMTELSPVSHMQPDDNVRHGSVGFVAPNTESMVADVATGQPLPPNEHGEICVRGPQVMLGYLNQPQATADMISPEGWLHTGDVGYVDQDGFFYVVDRVKELIKYKGYQVPPAELEAVLLTHPAVADAAVIPLPDEEAGEIPKAFVIKRADVSADDLMAYVAERVAPYKRLRELEFTDAIPKSSSGKILRRELVDRERARLGV